MNLPPESTTFNPFTAMLSSPSAKNDRDRSAQGGHAEATEPRPSSDFPGLIGLYSPSPGCGKTTVAKALAPYGYERISFAQPLRDMLTPLLETLGYHEGYLNKPHLKERPLREIGVSARDLLRTLGTEWGRTCVHPDIWAMLASSQIREVQRSGGLVVIDDVRFPNEAELIRKHGGQLWLITRKDAVQASGHASDTSMADWNDFDVKLSNNGTLRCLIDDVANLMEHP